MIGPVQEKETTASVNAIKKMPRKLPVPALLSAFVDHDDGKVISKAPKKEIPNTKNKAKKNRLAIQLVARLFNAAGPKMTVIRKPSSVKMMTMDVEYNTAFLIPSTFVLLRLVKKLTVTGIMEYTQGVSKASNPPANAVRNIQRSDLVATSLSLAATDKTIVFSG